MMDEEYYTAENQPEHAADGHHERSFEDQPEHAAEDFSEFRDDGSFGAIAYGEVTGPDGEPIPAVEGTGVTAAPEQLVPLDTVLAGRYTVNGAFPRRSRASESYLCTWRSRPFVAKVYEEGTGFDKAAANLLMQVNSPYLVRVLKAGSWEGHPFQVTEYFRNGSLEGKTFDMNEISEHIVPQLNRALKALHARGIVHGDLTPSNIMMGNDPDTFLISDYGSLLTGDPQMPELEEVTESGAPISYAAPETMDGPPTEESDYYSLGIILFVLYTGQLPVEQPRSVDVYAPRFDYPVDMPPRLQNLIIGLTHTDLSNQRNQANPNRRWTYNEVRRWCAGDTLQTPIESFGPGAAILPYTFEGRQYTSLGALVAAMAVNWTDGKAILFGGSLSEFFSVTDPGISKICERAETAVRHNPRRENSAYFETLYRLSPDLENLYWKGKYIGTPDEAGREFEKGKVSESLKEMVKEGALAGYFRARFPDEPKLARTMMHAEQMYGHTEGDEELHAVARMCIGRVLRDDYQYTADDRNFDNLNEFVHWCLELREQDREKWNELADTLVPGPGRLEPKFQAWLMALGNFDAIKSWTGGRTNSETVEPGSALLPETNADDEWIV